MKRLFIVGVGRSGTSLLQSMMSAHSSVVMMPETSFIRRYLVQSKFKDVSLKSIGSKELCADKYLQRWEGDQVVDAGMISAQAQLSPAEFYQNVVQNYALKLTSGDVSYVGEKDPKMIEVLDFLEDLVEDFLVLHIIRDPRDVVLSKSKAAWSMNQSLFKKIVANVAQMSIARRYKKKYPHSIYELHYEDLLEKPEEALRGVCDFLGFKYERNMLDFQREAANLISKDEMSWKKETLGPLLKTNINKWESEMSAMESTMIEKCCGLAMSSGNYKKTDVKLTLNQIVKIFIVHAAVIVISSLYVANAILMKKAFKR